MPDLPPRRECGKCSLCCTLLAAADLDKPAGVACPELGVTGGCSIYETRPQQCRDFFCLWATGHWGGFNSRPDQTGVIPVAEPSGREVHLILDPRYPQAWKRSAVRRQTRRFPAEMVKVVEWEPPVDVDVAARALGELMVKMETSKEA